MALPVLASELRAGLRTWARTPGVAATAILTLALGIGASTALFTIVHAVLIRPLPYRDADRLVVVRAEQDYEGASRPVRAPFPAAAVAGWTTPGPAFSHLAFFAEGVGALKQPTGSELIDTAIVEGAFFDTVGGPLAAGRGLTPADGAEPVAVISARLWRRHFAGTGDVLGQSLTVNGQVLTVVGVAAETFQLPRRTDDVWMTAGAARVRNPGCCGFTPIGRLANGVSIDAATSEVAATIRALAERLPRALSGTRVQVVPLRDALVSSVRPALLVMMGAVALLLTLATANVAGLLLARHTARAHEAGVRRALGASSVRLVREALAECAWLCAAGCLVGVALAWAAVRALQALAVETLPRLDTVHLDLVALAFAVAVAGAVTLAVGILPVLASGDMDGRLQQQGRGSTSAPRARFALGAITVGQLAISVVLLVAAVLLGRSLAALLRTDMGINPEHVATASINLAMDRTLTSRQQAELVTRIVERLATSPGVVAAGVGTSRPPDVSRMRLTLTRGSGPSERASYQAAGVPVTPGYFQALGIQLERGRLFTDADHAEAPPVVILSAGTARRLFPDQDPVGQRLGLPVLRDGKTAHEEMTIVGVARDVKFNGLDQEADDAVYRPFAQQPWVSAFLVVRTTANPDVAAGQFRREVAAIDPAIAVSDARSMDAVLAAVTTEPRLRTLVLGTFAVLAIVIAGVGLHGVVAFSVSQRRAEIGVRMALGATAGRIRSMVLREGLVLAVAGGALGLVGALGVTRAVSGLLFGVDPGDRAAFAAAALGVMAAGLAASYLPAWRASRTDPAVVLKGE